MNTFQLVWKNITQQWGSTLLSIILTAFGVAILVSIYITSDTFEKQLDSNSKQVDLVIGAKGSPLQLILSTLYHIDNPTGNIKLAEAEKIKDNPFIETAVPISLGDNYKGHRIIGTDTSYMGLYELSLAEGKLWTKSFEVVLGSETARKHQLKLGDEIQSAHGLAENAHIHDDHPFKVVGILKPSATVVDNLILCDLQSVWDVHGIKHDEHDHDHDHEHDHATHEHTEETDEHVNHNHEIQPAETQHIHTKEDEHSHEGHDHATTGHEEAEQKSNSKTSDSLVTERPRPNVLIKSIAEDVIQDHSLEITALLVKYSSPAAIGVVPKLINQSTSMQAASPALETARLFSLLGVGIDSLEILAYVIMIIAGLSVFISLYNALKDRKYDLAIMRALGASKIKLFILLIVEGLVITTIGGLLGLVFGHLGLYLIGTQTSQSADIIQAFSIYNKEWLILLTACLIGVIASAIPAIKAYNTTISTILGNK
ncbi:FtsX-like permease family protein [Sphingobacterium sp. DK4209]|uniref:FtsX-like permease family protein n=1 Tax=Sphingobacterium zhuxiongii TaxID=2662364 RepID=A0A5Q0QBM2_9SPHI|nr:MULTISPECIES: ABC transporter permease [unclassified Sphingobacterium]MVZ66448.1 FtsX-like permease family protein [Sphingobacterium sp. DK4209]QGA27295.1 FtsX-like permease family protein [Sphingobacterium sp. dk4302]